MLAVLVHSAVWEGGWFKQQCGLCMQWEGEMESKIFNRLNVAMSNIFSVHGLAC